MTRGADRRAAIGSAVPSASPPGAAPARPGRSLLALAMVLLLAANLRVAVASLGVLLPQVRASLGLSDEAAALLTTVPVWSFALFGSLAPVVSNRWGLRRTVLLALGLTLLGVAARPFVGAASSFVLLTAAATAGAALGNVLLPALARACFPAHVPLVSSLSGAALVAGNTVASGATVPLGQLLGGWRPALGIWAVLALAALVPAVLLRSGAGLGTVGPRAFPIRSLVGSRLAWMMVLLFGGQSATAYAQFGWLPTIVRDGGLSATEAGWMLAVVTGVSLPLTLLLPVLIRAVGPRPWLPLGFALLTMTGWIGVLLAPTILPGLWATFLGAGSTVFTWVLALLAQKSRTVEGTAALSGFVQGLGYVLATVGPFGAGWLHQRTGSWTAPLLGLVLLAALTGVAGVVVNRLPPLEDDQRDDQPLHDR